MKMVDKIDVLDHGYIRFVEASGSDLSVVNAARVSFDRESNEITDADIRLLKFLANNGHTSPFRHAMGTMEICAPLMVAREWWKYVVGSDHTMDGWNEVSRRYVADDLEFYIPEEWRYAPANMKQGSAGNLSPAMSKVLSGELEELVNNSIDLYMKATTFYKVAPEQARLFLPAYGLYTKWRWTFSLQSLIHVIQQRDTPEAQWEFQQYAKAAKKMWYPWFPHSMDAFLL